MAEHPDDLVRDQYVMQVADRCRLDAGRLRERLEYAAAPTRSRPTRAARGRERDDDSPPADYRERRRRSPASTRGSRRPGSRRRRAERSGLEALRLAVHRPEEVADRLDAVLFDDPVQRQAFVALLEPESVHEAVETAPPEVATCCAASSSKSPWR